MVKKCKFIEGLINCVLIKKQKVLRNGANTHHKYNNDYLKSDKIANIYTLQVMLTLKLETEIVMSIFKYDMKCRDEVYK